MADTPKNVFFLSDQQLNLVMEMIEGGTFPGRRIELVASLKLEIRSEIDTRAFKASERDDS